MDKLIEILMNKLTEIGNVNREATAEANTSLGAMNAIEFVLKTIQELEKEGEGQPSPEPDEKQT